MTIKGDPLSSVHLKLEWLRTHQKRIALRSLLLQLFYRAFIVGLVIIIGEWGLKLPPSGRLALLLSGGAAWLIWAGISLRKLFRDPRLKKGWEGEQFWAFSIGKHSLPEHYDRVLNALQVCRETEKPGSLYSAQLAREALYRVLSQIADLSLSGILDFQPFRRALSTTATTLLLVAGAFLIGGKALIDASYRLIHFNTTFVEPLPFTLTVEPAGGWAYRGEPIRFAIKAEGTAPNNALFWYRMVGSDLDQSIEVNISHGLGYVELEGFAHTFYYFVESGKFKTPRFRMEVVARPQVAELRWKLYPPPYTQLPSVIGKENSGDVEALPGSRWELEVKSTKDLKTAWVEWTGKEHDQPPETLMMDVQGPLCRLTTTITDEGKYRVRLIDRDGHGDKDPVWYKVVLLYDEPPVITLLVPENDTVIGEEMVVPIAAEALDDYGVLKVELVYHQLDDTLFARRDLPLPAGSRRAAYLETLWNIAPLDLLPGDAVEFWLEAWDNDRVKGPKKAQSAKRMVRLPTFEEIVTGAQEQEMITHQELNNAVESARQLKEAVEQLTQELKRNPQTDWQNRQEIQEALKDQSQLVQKVEEARKALEDLVNRLEAHDLVTPEILEKYQELQRLLEDIATPQLKEAMEKLRQAIETQDPESIRQALEEFDFRREEFLKQLERSLSILEQLQLERRMEELVRRAEEIRKGEQEILQRLEQSPRSEIPTSQETLARAEEALLQAMSEVSTMASQQKELSTQQQLDSLHIALTNKALPAQMRQVGQKIASGDQKGAIMNLQQLTHELTSQELALKTLSANLTRQRKEELQRRLERIFQELLMISEAQENLIQESEAIGMISPRYPQLASRQAQLYQGIVELSERMLNLSQQTFFITPEMGASLGRALQQMGEAVESFTSRYPRSAKNSQERAL
ncbi:MAG: DUF4175 family protein, partial [bacterium]